MKTLGILLDRLKSSLRNDTCLLCEQALPVSPEETICMACEKRIRMRQPNPVVKTDNGPIYAACEFPHRIKRLIYDLKFEYRTANGIILAEILAHYWQQLSMPPSPRRIVVPVPPHAGATVSHSGLIARPFASHFRCDFAEDLLVWRHNIEPQHTILNRCKRKDNMKDALALNPETIGRYGAEPEFLVIDDLTTTGATLTEALATLKRDIPGCKATALAVSHVPLQSNKY